ncbi:hypothetical protein K458DRAFT_391998 [Lentithecium fluviatile CBS 122367]|uniref:Uncharacterized protein n=1 Tax=Lentithecium fluviatile CBS 122367 TaxID=1168545 RepID=A0A6G1ISI4_9PLEO|nr:hypothetical protein K458DRAFT_391998 [Lentithecium fluviatile CBS 122367]
MRPVPKLDELPDAQGGRGLISIGQTLTSGSASLNAFPDAIASASAPFDNLLTLSTAKASQEIDVQTNDFIAGVEAQVAVADKLKAQSTTPSPQSGRVRGSIPVPPPALKEAVVRIVYASNASVAPLARLAKSLWWVRVEEPENFTKVLEASISALWTKE